MANNSIKKMVELAVNITAKGFEKSGTTINGLATRLKTATKHALELSKALGMNGLGGTIRQLTGLTAALGGVFTLTSKEIRLLAKAFIDKTSSIRSVKQALDGAAGSVNDYRIRIDLLTEQINALNPADKRHNQLLAEKVRLQGLLNAELAKQNPQKGRSSSVLDADIQKEKELAAQRKASAKEQQALMKQSEASVIKQIEAKRKALAIEDELMRKSDLSVRKQISDAERKRSSAAIAEENRLMKESNADVKKQIALQNQQYSRSFIGRIQTAVRWVGAYFIAGQAFLQIQRLLNFVFIDSIKAFITYEDELKKLQAITGASVEEVNQLSEAAINLAKATIFTSTEIVELQKQLAKLGFSVSEIKDAQAGIAAFAQVTGVTIDQSAELVGKAIRAFNLSASSSQRIVNTFITGINKSALSGEYLATSMQYVASIGDQLNASVEMVTASLGILANAGFTASRAGTGLRLIFTEIGSAGEDLTDTMRRLKEENISLSEAKELVGQRGAGALLTLINRYEQVNQLVEMSNDQTRRLVAEMTTLSSKANALKQLGVVFQEAQKSAGETLFELLRINDAVLYMIDIVENKGLGGVALEFINIATGLKFISGDLINFERRYSSMASSRIRLSKLISNATKEEVDLLMDVNKTEGERQEILDGIIKRMTLNGELTKSEIKYLKSNFATRGNIMKIIDDEAKLIKSITDQESERLRFYNLMSDELSSIFVEGKSYEQSVNELNKAYEDSTRQLDYINLVIKSQSEELEKIVKSSGVVKDEEIERAKFLEQSLVMLKGQAEALKQIQNRYTDIKELEAFEATNLKTKADYNEAILNREKAIAILRKDGKLSEDEKKRLERFKEEISYLEKRRDLLFGVDEKTRGGFDAEDNEIVKIAEISKFASMSTEELVNEFIRLNEQLDHAKKIGDSYGIAEAALGLESLVNYLLPTVSGRLDEFSQIYGRIFIGDNAEKELERVSSFFKDAMDYYEKGVNDFISSAEKTNEAWNKLGGFSKWILSEFTDMSEDTIQKYAEAQVRVAQQFKKTATEAVNAINESIQANLDSEIRAVEARYSYEEKRYKAMLDANIINQQQYEKKLEKLEKERVEKTNEIERKRFNANKLNSIAEAAIETAIAMIRAETWVERLLVGILGATQIGIIGAQQYTPTQFEKGGVVEGRSHAEGGVPFTVRGRGGYEMEGGEFIVNKKATQKNLPLLEQINAGATTVSSRPMRESRSKYADGGMVGGDMTMLLAEIRNELKRPVRAYVSERELIGKMNERVDIKKRSAR